MPVAPRASLREPTRYQICSDTIGLRWSSSSSTRRPLSSVAATTARRLGLAENRGGRAGGQDGGDHDQDQRERAARHARLYARARLVPAGIA